MTEPKKTVLYERHIEGGGRIVNYAGWLLPIEYTSVLKESLSVRKNSGLFDVSHMGEISIRGKGAHNFLQELTANDIFLIKEGELQYNLFLNPDGGIIDDLLVYNLGESYLCVVNANNTDKVYNWLMNYKNKDVEVVNQSDETALISLQGPDASIILNFICDINNLKYMQFMKTKINGVNVIISRSGYTGEDGFEIYIPNENAVFLWDLLVEKGKGLNLQLCGLGARDILRIEAGYSLYGHEIDETIDPFRAGLSWVVKLNNDFIGKGKIIERRNSIKEKRIGFIMDERAIPRENYLIYNDKCEEIGKVSSGTFSPNLDEFIGMGYVKKAWTAINTPLMIKIRDRHFKARVVNLPFIEIRIAKEIRLPASLAAKRAGLQV